MFSSVSQTKQTHGGHDWEPKKDVSVLWCCWLLPPPLLPSRVHGSSVVPILGFLRGAGDPRKTIRYHANINSDRWQRTERDVNVYTSQRDRLPDCAVVPVPVSRFLFLSDRDLRDFTVCGCSFGLLVSTWQIKSQQNWASAMTMTMEYETLSQTYFFASLNLFASQGRAFVLCHMFSLVPEW